MPPYTPNLDLLEKLHKDLKKEIESSKRPYQTNAGYELQYNQAAITKQSKKLQNFRGTIKKIGGEITRLWIIHARESGW